MESCTKNFLPDSQEGKHQTDDYEHDFLIFGIDELGMTYKKCSYCKVRHMRKF